MEISSCGVPLASKNQNSSVQQCAEPLNGSPSSKMEPSDERLDAEDQLPMSEALPCSADESTNCLNCPKNCSDYAACMQDLNPSERMRTSHDDIKSEICDNCMAVDGTFTAVTKHLQDEENSNQIPAVGGGHENSEIASQPARSPEQNCAANEVTLQPLEESSRTKYTLSNGLKFLTGSWKDFDDGNYFRGCKWSPDGSCILTCSNDNKMRIFNLPTELYSSTETKLPEMSAAITMPQRESVNDFCWYPRMSSWEPETCCFLTCCKDHPIHLWDAFCHQHRASYVPYNHLDEVMSPYSIACSLDGERIFAGFLKSVKVFQLSRPGRECISITTHTKKTGGQSGIISCIAMSPAVPRLYALGSYSCSIGVYSEDVEGAVMLLTGINSGVTHTLFSQDGVMLYTGFRKDNMIVGWDLRNPGQALQTMTRECDTNQRIYFDTLSDGSCLVSGSTCGCVYGWEVGHEEGEGGRREEEALEPYLQFRAHTDAVNGVSVHPTLPILATCSGQRHFPLPGAGVGGGEESSSEEEEEEEEEEARARGCTVRNINDGDIMVSKNCLKLWSFDLEENSHCRKRLALMTAIVNRKGAIQRLLNDIK